MTLSLKINPLVDLLRSYGPLASSNAQFDEHVQQMAARRGVDPIEVETPRIKDVVESVGSQPPIAIVLTGTAGDGKTYTFRQALQALNADMSAWGDHKVIDLQLPEGLEVRVVKDLAELTDDEKRKLYLEFASLVTGEGSRPLLIAANDGQLVAFVRQFKMDHPAGEAIDEAIRQMLVADEPTRPGYRLQLYNLSRHPHDKLFGEVVQAIADHPGWAHCEGCVLYDAKTCAIRHNLSVLVQDAKPSLRSRLADVIRLAALNDTHLPVRQLLLLCSNILLGDSKTGGLIRCGQAHELAMNGGASDRVNPYRNALGLNFEEPTREQFRAFSVFSSFGLGRETNNHIDELLIEQEPADDFKAYLAADQHFGDPLLAPVRKQYRANPADVDMGVLHDALADQRLRLFFVLPEDHATLEPWRLTIFAGGGQYLDFANGLVAGRDTRSTKRRLITGLNRAYTGLMADDEDKLWLSGPAGYTQSRQGRVLDTLAPIRLGATAQDRLSVDFDGGGVNQRPRLVLCCDGKLVHHLEVTPLLFEYLTRIQTGSLPSSFSRQCFEELRQFRLRSVAELTGLGLVPADANEVHLVRLMPSGRLMTAPLVMEA